MEMLECVACDYDFISYITEGKFYEIAADYENGSYDIVDDDGDIVYVSVPYSCHGQFRLVEVYYGIDHKNGVLDNSISNLSTTTFVKENI